MSKTSNVFLSVFLETELKNSHFLSLFDYLFEKNN